MTTAYEFCLGQQMATAYALSALLLPLIESMREAAETSRTSSGGRGWPVDGETGQAVDDYLNDIEEISCDTLPVLVRVSLKRWLLGHPDADNWDRVLQGMAAEVSQPERN